MKFECPTNSDDMTALERASFILEHADGFKLTAHQNGSVRAYCSNALWFAGGLRKALLEKISEKPENQRDTLLTSIETVTQEDIANAILCGHEIKSAFPEDVQKLTGVWRYHVDGIKELQKHIPTLEML